MQKVVDFKNYSGDVNLEYGGFFADFSDWQYDYVNVLRVTDLDSVGFAGAVAVERLTVFIPDEKSKLDSMLSVIGGSADRYWHKTEDRLRKNLSRDEKMTITEAALWYGYYDPDSDYWHNPMFPQKGYMIVIQTDPDPDYASMSFDGWTADIRLPEDVTLFEYLLSEGYLSEFE